MEAPIALCIMEHTASKHSDAVAAGIIKAAIIVLGFLIGGYLIWTKMNAGYQPGHSTLGP